MTKNKPTQEKLEDAVSRLPCLAEEWGVSLDLPLYNYRDMRGSIKNFREDISYYLHRWEETPAPTWAILRGGSCGGGGGSGRHSLYYLLADAYRKLEPNSGDHPTKLLIRGDQLLRAARTVASDDSNRLLATKLIELAADNYLAASFRGPIGAGKRAARLVCYVDDLEDTKLKELIASRLRSNSAVNSRLNKLYFIIDRARRHIGINCEEKSDINFKN